MSTNAVSVDLNGVILKGYRDIRASLHEQLKEKFGDDLDLSASSPEAQLTDIFAYAYAEIAQGIQAIISNLDVQTANGVFLDYLASIAGVSRDGMTDSELRKFMQTSNYNGLATVEGMRTYLRDTLGSNGISVIEDTNEHTIHVVVDNEELQPNAIADAIFFCKPAGIKTIGSEEALTSEGVEIHFDYIQSGSLTLAVRITRYSEETLPEDYAESIKNALVEYVASNMNQGKDIIVKRLYAPIYEAVSGVSDISIAATFNGTTSVDGVIAVDDGKVVTLAKSDITLEIA